MADARVLRDLAEEVERSVLEMHTRITALEAENAKLREDVW